MRIVTWNICGAKGMDGLRSSERIFSTLRELNADIICLQEVHRYLPGGALENQPGRLSHALNMHLEYASAVRLPLAAFGNAILSRWPIRTVHTHELPNPLERKRPGLWFERRIAQEVQIDAPFGMITVFNTHWSLKQDDRLAASELIAQRLRTIADRVILCGDLNAHAGTGEVSRLVKEGLADCGASTDLPTYPADNPRSRIDYVFTRDFTVRSATVLDIQHSDHRPVVIDLQIETS